MSDFEVLGEIAPNIEKMHLMLDKDQVNTSQSLEYFKQKVPHLGNLYELDITTDAYKFDTIFLTHVAESFPNLLYFGCASGPYELQQHIYELQIDLLKELEAIPLFPFLNVFDNSISFFYTGYLENAREIVEYHFPRCFIKSVRFEYVTENRY